MFCDGLACEASLLARCGSQALDIKRFLICMNIEAADGLCPQDTGHQLFQYGI